MRPVLLTRPAAQCAPLAAKCAAAGLRAHVFAPLELVADTDALAQLPALAAAADWLIPVSPGAIDIMWPVLAGHLPETVQLACVGKGSAAHLAALAGRAVLHPEAGSDSEALLALPPLFALSGQTVLIVRGETGRALLADTLAARGATILLCEAYRRVACDPGWDKLPADMAQATLLVTSSDIARALFASVPAARRDWLLRQQFVTLHPRISEVLQSLGASKIVTAANASDDALLAALAAC